MDKQAIRKLQATLLRIKNKEQVFFNLVQFENMGLITTRSVAVDGRHRESTTGELMRKTEFLLTPKAHQLLSIAV